MQAIEISRTHQPNATSRSSSSHYDSKAPQMCDRQLLEVLIMLCHGSAQLLTDHLANQSLSTGQSAPRALVRGVENLYPWPYNIRVYNDIPKLVDNGM